MVSKLVTKRIFIMNWSITLNTKVLTTKRIGLKIGT